MNETSIELRGQTWAGSLVSSHTGRCWLCSVGGGRERTTAGSDKNSSFIVPLPLNSRCVIWGAWPAPLSYVSACDAWLSNIPPPSAWRGRDSGEWREGEGWGVGILGTLSLKWNEVATVTDHIILLPCSPSPQPSEHNNGSLFPGLPAQTRPRNSPLFLRYYDCCTLKDLERCVFARHQVCDHSQLAD